MSNPNNLIVGNTILVEQAWEDEMGNYHDEWAEIVDIEKETGKLKLNFYQANDKVKDFLQGAEFYAQDYKAE